VRGLLLSLCCCITLLPINASADQKWDENLRWRHLFSLATEEQLGSANDVQQIQRSVMEASGTPDPRLGSIRWISRSVVCVRADLCTEGERRGRILYIVEKRRKQWTVMHKVSFPPTYLNRPNQTLQPTPSRRVAKDEG